MITAKTVPEMKMLMETKQIPLSTPFLNYIAAEDEFFIYTGERVAVGHYVTNTEWFKIIDLKNGDYYVVENDGVDIWEFMFPPKECPKLGRCPRELVEVCSRVCPGM